MKPIIIVNAARIKTDLFFQFSLEDIFYNPRVYP
jgi:hypothetical protein